MHELSIAMSIVDLAEEEAQRLGGARVTAVHLQLGRLSGVVKEALQSSYEMARGESVLVRESELVIEEVPVVIYCATCGGERAIRSIQDFRCPSCGTPARDVRRGRELEVVSLEVLA